jgi:hypothetical protein
MARPWFACLIWFFFVSFVDPLVFGHAQVKLSPEELATRKEKAGGDPVRLMELMPLVDPVAAPELRRHLAKILVGVPAADRAELARKAAPLLSAAVATPDECRQLLGPPQRISRQMVYRRCIEQWTYDLPVPLCINWQAAAGQEMQIQAVHALAAKNH